MLRCLQFGRRSCWQRWLVICMVFCGSFFCLRAEAAVSGIEEVTAVVEADQNLPTLVRDRMQASVRTIAEQLLLGHALEEAQQNHAHYEQVIREVFDKVLVGYSVQEVSLEPAVSSKVHVRLLPWSDVIRQTQVEVIVDGMPPEIERLVRQDLSGIDQVFSQGLSGLPLAATDWTNGVLKRGLNSFMEEHLPEFRADFDMDPQEVTRVKVVVYPRLPMVRTVDLNMRSDTVPNVSLLNHRQLMQEKANLLIGVPVAFVRRHEDTISRNLEQTLDARPDFRILRMHTKVALHVGEQTAVMCRSDTDGYRLRLEGWADIGRSGENPIMFRSHIGRKFSRADEIFLQTDFYPQHMLWHWDLGYARGVADGTQLFVRYDLKQHKFVLGAEYELGRQWLLRYEYRWADEKGEAAVRYRMHDFLSLEYVVDKDDRWLRLIGNF